MRTDDRLHQSIRQLVDRIHKPGEGVLGAVDARAKEGARECKPQNVANILWAYATMGSKPGERALREVEGWAEEVAREGNSEAVRVMRRALGALDTKAAVLSAGFGVREGALHVGGSYQNRGISLLDQLGGGGQLGARVEG